MTIDTCIPTTPGRNTSGFHRPHGNCLHQQREGPEVGPNGPQKRSGRVLHFPRKYILRGPKTYRQGSTTSSQGLPIFLNSDAVRLSRCGRRCDAPGLVLPRKTPTSYCSRRSTLRPNYSCLTWSLNYRTTVVKTLLVLARLEFFVRLGVFHTVFSTKEVTFLFFFPKSLFQIHNYQIFNICRVLYPIVLKPHRP